MVTKNVFIIWERTKKNTFKGKYHTIIMRATFIDSVQPTVVLAPPLTFFLSTYVSLSRTSYGSIVERKADELLLFDHCLSQLPQSVGKILDTLQLRLN